MFASECDELVPNGFAYLPDFLSVDEEDRLLTRIEQEPFAVLRVRGQRTRRSTVSYGREFRPYVAVLPPAPPLPRYLHSLRDRAASIVRLDGKTLRQALITAYPERAGIGWHIDHASFGDVVLCVSLLGRGTLWLRRDDQVHHFVIAPRSLYVLAANARTEYEHRFIADALRYSITLRTLR